MNSSGLEDVVVVGAGPGVMVRVHVTSMTSSVPMPVSMVRGPTTVLTM